MKKLIAGLASTGMIATMLVAGATTASASSALASPSVSANTTMTNQIFTAAKKKKPKKSKASNFAKNINKKVKKKLKGQVFYHQTNDLNQYPMSKKSRYFTNTEGANINTVRYFINATSSKQATKFVSTVERELKKKGFKKYRFANTTMPEGFKTQDRAWHNKNTLCVVQKFKGSAKTLANFSCLRKSELKKAVKASQPFVTAYDKLAKKKNKVKRGTVKKPIVIDYPFMVEKSLNKKYRTYKKAVTYISNATPVTFAKAPKKKWTVVSTGKNVEQCKNLEKTKVSSRAWAKEPCLRGKSNSTVRVK